MYIAAKHHNLRLRHHSVNIDTGAAQTVYGLLHVENAESLPEVTSLGERQGADRSKVDTIWYIDLCIYIYRYFIILLCDICKYSICIYMLTHFYDIGMYIHLNDILVISFDTVLWHSAFYKPRKQSFHVGYSRLWSPSSPRTCPIWINLGWDDFNPPNISNMGGMI